MPVSEQDCSRGAGTAWTPASPRFSSYGAEGSHQQSLRFPRGGMLTAVLCPQLVKTPSMPAGEGPLSLVSQTRNLTLKMGEK